MEQRGVLAVLLGRSQRVEVLERVLGPGRTIAHPWRTAAREWARHDILCNVICPAAATESYRAVMDANPEMERALLAQHPMHRMGDPEEDIGGAALFLASDDARYVTGNTLHADGGGHINGVNWEPPVA